MGQTWSKGVSALFLWYVEHSPIVEFPQWALAAYWFYKPADISWMPLAGYDFGISERIFVHDDGTLVQNPEFVTKLADRQRLLTASRIRTSEVSPYLCYMRRAHYGHDSKYVQAGCGISQGAHASTQSMWSSIQGKDAETQVLPDTQDSSSQCGSSLEDHTMHGRLQSKAAVGDSSPDDHTMHGSLESKAAVGEPALPSSPDYGTTSESSATEALPNRCRQRPLYLSRLFSQ